MGPPPAGMWGHSGLPSGCLWWAWLAASCPAKGGVYIVHTRVGVLLWPNKVTEARAGKAAASVAAAIHRMWSKVRIEPACKAQGSSSLYRNQGW